MEARSATKFGILTIKQTLSVPDLYPVIDLCKPSSWFTEVYDPVYEDSSVFCVSFIFLSGHVDETVMHPLRHSNQQVLQHTS